MSVPPALDLAALPRLSMAQLRAVWAQHMGRAQPPVQKRLLIRELAWRTQERAQGGLDARTRRLLNAAVRAAIAADSAAILDVGRSPADAHARPRQRRRCLTVTLPLARQLPPAARLVRTWRGKAHEVCVLDGGRAFRYLDKTYGSLSEVARQITGAHWSGPRFFGLATRRGVEDATPSRSTGPQGARRAGSRPA